MDFAHDTKSVGDADVSAGSFVDDAHVRCRDCDGWIPISTCLGFNLVTSNADKGLPTKPSMSLRIVNNTLCNIGIHGHTTVTPILEGDM